MSTSLATVFDDVARGAPPDADGSVEVFPAPPGLTAAVFAFTAHLVVATDVDRDVVAALAPAWDFDAWVRVADRIAGVRGRRALSGDVACCAVATARPIPLPLERDDAHEHPRVDRAARYRDDLAVYVTPDRDGLVTLGRGVAGRYEMAFEVEPQARGRGLGRALAAAALAIVPPGETVWAQVNPGNAASLRAVLAAGFTPAGYEQLVP